MADDCCINNLPRIKVCEVLHSHGILGIVSPKFIYRLTLVWRHHGGQELTKTSVIEFAIEPKSYYSRALTR